MKTKKTKRTGGIFPITVEEPKPVVKKSWEVRSKWKSIYSGWLRKVETVTSQPAAILRFNRLEETGSRDVQLFEITRTERRVK